MSFGSSASPFVTAMADTDASFTNRATDGAINWGALRIRTVDTAGNYPPSD